jgi:parvulin-like peptidyl-prolyl isomerase
MRSIPILLILLIALSSAAAVFGQDDAAPDAEAADLNPVVFRVNGDPIYAFEISMIMQNLQTQLQQRGEQVDTSEIAQVATQRIIEQKLLVQEARRFGIEADELQIARAAQVAEQQSGGRVMLEARLKAAGSSYDQFVGVIRDMEMMRLFIERQIAANVTVTQEEIETFYNENPDALEAGDRVHAYHMIFVAQQKDDAEALAAARARAEAARERAVTGDEDFTTLARELSEGPSAQDGGDLGWVDKESLIAPMGDALFALEPGDISPVFETEFGFHVGTVTEQRPAGKLTLDEAAPGIESLLRQKKTADTVGELLVTLVENAQVVNLLGQGPVIESGGGTE